MSVLAQTLFTLVRSHLVAFVLLTVWHINKVLNELLQEKRKESAGKTIPNEQILSYDSELVNASNNDIFSVINLIPSDETVENNVISNILYDEYKSHLSDRNKRIFELFSAGYKQREISKIVGCSQAQVSRIEKKVIKKLQLVNF